jgi:hypothetical protein
MEDFVRRNRVLRKPVFREESAADAALFALGDAISSDGGGLTASPQRLPRHSRGA